MILVTLGTQDKDFKRLLDAVQKQIDNGTIKDKVVVQAGFTNYVSRDMEIFDLIPIDEFNKLIQTADLIITHGGVGSIMEGIQNNKKVIAAPRLKEYGEHVNNHQLQIIRNFVASGYILSLEDFDKLDEVIKKSKTFNPKKFESNTANMIKIITKFMDQKQK